MRDDKECLGSRYDLLAKGQGQNAYILVVWLAMQITCTCIDIRGSYLHTDCLVDVNSGLGN